jgi:hypothetical protein
VWLVWITVPDVMVYGTEDVISGGVPVFTGEGDGDAGGEGLGDGDGAGEGDGLGEGAIVGDGDAVGVPRAAVR